jgi:hypothetical protein
MVRTCSQCGAQLTRYNPGKLCFPCQEKRKEKMSTDTGPNYNVPQMMVLMGLKSEEQVKRLGREGLIPGRVPLVKEHLYNKEVINEWIKSGGLPLHRPTNPLQQEAYKLCKKKDHGWFSDEKFDGIAYGTETISERGKYTINISHRRTCYFCNYSDIVSG